MTRFLFKKYFGITPLFAVLFFLTSCILYKNPSWDIAVSSLFYIPGEGFYMEYTWWAIAVYRGVHIISTIMCVLYAIFIIVSYIKKKSTLLGISRKAIIYMALVFVIGPGLIINIGLKENFGRARPANTTIFGGNKEFTPAFVITNQCKSNCSFVSGHASFGYYFIAPAFIATACATRVAFFTTGSLMGLAIGIVRVIQGRHFFSDIILSFFFVYIAAAVISYFMYDRNKI